MKIITFILAGGKGQRLGPLTVKRTKPAVPFFGIYRLIDFTLSNAVHSGLKMVYLLIQYRSEPLERHLLRAWASRFDPYLREVILALPPQLGMAWYRGTADAIFQCLYLLQREKPDLVVILSGDHIYRMDYRPFIQFHLSHGKPFTLTAAHVPLSEASRFGILKADPEGNVTAFVEKPSNPFPSPFKADAALINMGIYVADTAFLAKLLAEDSKNSHSSHDFGKDLLPLLAKEGNLSAFLFEKASLDDPPYWMDVGTLDSYYEVSMAMLNPHPPINLWDEGWSIHTFLENFPPAHVEDSPIENAYLAPGSWVQKATIRQSIIGKKVHIHPGARIIQSILFDGVVVGEGAIVENAIIDKYSHIPSGTILRSDAPLAKLFYNTPKGVMVLPRNTSLDVVAHKG